MRAIVFDTETTGLKTEEGHRLIEIGAIELSGGRPSGRQFHAYLDPCRDIPAEAEAVHGIGAAQLAGKPKFAEIAPALLAFIGDAPLIAHNAFFDLGFLNFELAQAGHAAIPAARITDTLAIARAKFPNASNTLSALCRRFEIDDSGREKHGALLDAALLAEIYPKLLAAKPDFRKFYPNRSSRPRSAAPPAA